MIRRSIFRSWFLIILIFVVLNFIALNVIDTPLSPIAMSGRLIDNSSGIVRIKIEKYNAVKIYSPQNISYDFNQSDLFILPLNVSADFIADGWMYSLYDVKHDVWVEQNTPFTPNTTITAVRWQNKLTVYAHQQDADWNSANVSFFINVPNTAPILGNLTNETFVCEGGSLSYPYNATDIDEEILATTISNPFPFFARSVDYDNNITTFFEIVSLVPLQKNYFGGPGFVSSSYEKTITVYDAEPLVDTGNITITIIEINNPPVIHNQLGAQTVWLIGDDSNFSHVYNVTDIEDGNTTDENLTFNLSFGPVSNLFDIDSLNGSMYYTPTIDDIGIYDLTACVYDNPLSASDENFSICKDQGYSNESWLVCDTFSLTITNDNRPPQIINWTPTGLTFGVGGLSHFSHFAEVYDADGTIPDIDWYVDGVLVEHNENMSLDNFDYFFPCGVSGLHTVEIVTTDGLLNDSVSWNISVSEISCDEPEGGGGGAGGLPKQCSEDWVCGDWDVCQNVERSLENAVFSKEDYINFRDICLQEGYDDERFCGFQVKSCYDLNNCNNPVQINKQPGERRACYYTENPSCNDGITNCHDGSCESLVDCGGPCKPCPTCSDGIQNQGERGTDCGGPCPFVCEPELPHFWITTLLVLLSIALSLAIIYFGYKLFVIIRRRYYSY